MSWNVPTWIVGRALHRARNSHALADSRLMRTERAARSDISREEPRSGGRSPEEGAVRDGEFLPSARQYLPEAAPGQCQSRPNRLSRRSRSESDLLCPGVNWEQLVQPDLETKDTAELPLLREQPP